MSPPVPAIQTITFDDYRGLLESEQFDALRSDPNYIWRGQENAWDLRPGSYRASLDRFDYAFTDLMAQQLELLARGLEAKFRDSSITNAPLPIRLAAAQHLGLLTPCLDWSESSWVGLFFSTAIESDRPNGEGRVLYALDKRRTIPVRPDHGEWSNQGLILVTKSNIEQHIPSNNAHSVWIDRLKSQQGCVLLVGRAGGHNSVESHIENKAHSFEAGTPGLVRIIYGEPNKRSRIELLNHLFEENKVDYMSLFPDQVGLINDIRLRGFLTGYKGANPAHYQARNPFDL